MTTAEKMEQRHREDLERLRRFRLMDDDFFTKCFDGQPACVALVLQIVLQKEDLQVEDVRTQVFLENMLHRSVRLDVLATDGAGRKYNIEIQRSDKGAGRKRARYNSSMLDATFSDKGEDFSDLPETYVIFITEHDVIGRGYPVYHVEKIIEETGERFDDGSHILYVNGAYRDETPIGRLMHDFACENPSEMRYGVLAERVKFFKESKEGVAIMCRAMEDMRNLALEEGRAEGRAEGRTEGIETQQIIAAKRMLLKGALSVEDIAEYNGLSVDRVRKLQAER